MTCAPFRAGRRVTRPSFVPDNTGGVNHCAGRWKWSSVARDQPVEWTSISCEVLAMVNSFSIRPESR